MEKKWHVLVSACVVLVILLTTVLIGCAPKAAPAAQTTPAAKKAELTFGTIIDLTGPYSGSTGPFFHGLSDVFQWANETGFIPGVTIVHKFEDDKGDPAVAIPGYKRLSSATPSPVMMLACETPIALALKDSINKDKIPTATGGIAAALVWPPAYVFSNQTLYENQFATYVNYFMDNVWKGSQPPKFAVLTWDTGVGRSFLSSGAAKKFLADKGIPIVAEIYIPASPTDTTSEMLTLKNSGADFTWGAIHSVPWAVVMKDAEAQGLAGKVVFGQGALCDPTLAIQRAPKASEGSIVIGTMRNTIADFEKYIPEILAVSRKNGRTDTELTLGCAAGYQSGIPAIEALKRAVAKVGADKVTANDVYEALQTLKDYDPRIGPPIDYSEGKRMGPSSAFILRVQNGAVPTPWPMQKVPDLLVKN